MKFRILLKGAKIPKKRNRFLGIFFSICLFSTILSQAGAQEHRRGDTLLANKESEVDQKRSFVSVAVASGYSKRAAIHKASGPYDIKSTPQPFWEAGIDYRRQLNQSLYFIVGLRGTVTGRNAVFDAPIDKVNPSDYMQPFPPLTMNEFDFGIAIPLLLEKSWQINKNKSAYVQGGINLRYSLGYDVDSYGYLFYDTSGNPINVFSMELRSNNYKKPWITYNLGGGYGWRLKNYNILRVGVLANISFTRFVKGTYQINIPGQPLTEGTYSNSGSFIGVSVGYVFTAMNKRLIKAYEIQR